MSGALPGMVDAVFDVSGDSVPENYPFALWSELVRLVPELESAPRVGVLPLRTTGSGTGMLLPRRAKLVVRIPAALAASVGALSGAELDLGGLPLRLAHGRLREIQPYPTIHAHLVVGAEDEVAFVEEITACLAELGIVANLICGRHNTLVDSDRQIRGFSLVLHDLKAEDSLHLQYAGLGSHRQYGCGVFVPYKVISDLG
jgi:CRISPR-associated protein Cas6